MSEIAAASWVLGDSLAQTFQVLRDLGVRLIELSAGEEPPNPDLRDPTQVAEMARLAAETGVCIFCVHTEFRGRWNLNSPEEAVRRFAIEANQQVIRGAGQLGAGHVVLHPGAELNPGESLAEQLDRALGSMRALAPVAAEVGVRLAVENLPPDHLGGSLEQVQALLSALDPTIFWFCCDTGHAAVAGEGPAAYVRAFADRLLGVHWHDNGGEDDHRFPGLGEVDWEDFFAALRGINYALPITVEALPPEGLPLAEAAAIVRESAAALRPPRLPLFLRKEG